jgi:purine-binding chemotaxis protein CheW
MSVDWNEVHLRLEAAAAALAEGSSPSVEAGRAILKRRARELARGTGPAPAERDLVQIIEFKLASEAYGIENAFVREVHPLKDLTPLPSTPSFVLGIVNLRGQILSIVDLRIFFDLPARGLGELNKIVVIRDAGMEFGILADEVIGVRAVPRSRIQPPLPTLSGIAAEYLMGITDSGMIILDARAILRDEGIVVCEEAAGGGGE